MAINVHQRLQIDCSVSSPPSGMDTRGHKCTTAWLYAQLLMHIHTVLGALSRSISEALIDRASSHIIENEYKGKSSERDRGLFAPSYIPCQLFVCTQHTWSPFQNGPQENYLARSPKYHRRCLSKPCRGQATRNLDTRYSQQHSRVSNQTISHGLQPGKV